MGALEAYWHGQDDLARLIVNYCQAQFLSLFVVLAGIKEVRVAVEKAQRVQTEAGRETILLIDEVHRFNKTQ